MNLFKRYRQLKKISVTSLLEESPHVQLIFWGVTITTVIIIALIIWASFATIQEVAVTYGEIIPKGRVQIVQHLEGGIVERVLVSDGDRVKRGQFLIQIDSKTALAELEKVRSQEISLILDKERLQALLDQKSADSVPWQELIARSKYNTPEHRGEVEQLINKQKELLTSQIEEHKNQTTILQAELSQNKEQLKKLENQLKVWEKHIALLTEEFEMYRKLKEKNYISHRDYLIILRDLNHATGEKARLTSEIIRSQKAVVESEYKLKTLDATRRSETLKELGTINSNLLAAKHQLEKLEASASHMHITSPIDGTVKGIRVFAGNVVQPGGLLLEVVPTGQAMIAETRVNPRDIGHIKVGDPVTVKVITYDFARYGSIKGRLTEISASTFFDKDNVPYYRAITELNQQYLVRRGEKKYLVSGMTIQADILTGKKTLMQYLLKPIRTATSMTFRER